MLPPINPPSRDTRFKGVAFSLIMTLRGQKNRHRFSHFFGEIGFPRKGFTFRCSNPR